MQKYIKIFGVRIDKVTLNSALEKVKFFLQEERAHCIFTPNTEIVMEAKRDSCLKDILNNGDLTIPDGIGIVYASKIKRKPLSERVTGYDLSIKIVELANKEGYSIYILGGKEGVAERAAANIKQKYSNVRIAGVHNGYFKGAHTGFANSDEEKQIITNINESKADILFVCLGVPNQEIWIDANKKKLDSRVIIGNGGTVDVIAGDVKRAPDIFQKLGLEWLYRLIKQPSRIKRQIVLPLFMLNVLFSGKNVVE